MTPADVLPAAAAALTSVPPTATPASEFTLAGDHRTFAIDYVAQLPAAPAGSREIRVWLPVPPDTPLQRIRQLSFDHPPELATGAKYGNRIAYWRFAAGDCPRELRMHFVCTRRELRTDLGKLAAAGDGVDRDVRLAVFTQPERLTVLSPAIRELADRIVGHETTTLGKAHAIYAYVLAHMRYDKTGTGWGTGSTTFACDTGRGNCTDFHALFNSLCRAEGIASEFEIGLYLPYDRADSAAASGYHCWAYFRVPGRTWVPVDCSEASREPGRREFFFGSHTANRVTLSVGRDLVLTPRQAGAPLNYFVEPYVEADGQPLPARKTWTFRNLD